MRKIWRRLLFVSAVTFLSQAHLIAGSNCDDPISNQKARESLMKKLVCRLVGLSFLTISLPAFAQSGGDTMKQDSMKPDTITKQDQMKKDDMAK
jgi:hypothetical protein